MNPRNEINKQILNRELDVLMENAGKLHGHFCPGLAMGVIAGYMGMSALNQYSDGLEDILAIVETNNCMSDGIQYVTGCTFGNNSLIFKDFGKIAFTICNRDGVGVRIVARNDSRTYVRTAHPYFSEKYKTVVKEQNRSVEEIAEFKRLGKEAAFSILKLDFDKIFELKKVTVEIPPYAPSHESVVCEKCGESVMFTRIFRNENLSLCLECSGEKYFQLDGHGISIV